MLQIIGWLGCLYLVIKGLEIGSSSAFLGADGKAKGLATLACMLSFAGSVIFAIWLYEQGNAGARSVEPDYTTEKLSGAASGADCVMKAKTADEILACEKAAGVTPEELGLPVNDCTTKAQTEEEMRACSK